MNIQFLLTAHCSLLTAHCSLFFFHLFLRSPPLAHNNSVFIFDDIHWSKEMQEAWQEMIAYPEVRVSIDTFQWGLIFFRKEQTKQDFTIRV